MTERPSCDIHSDHRAGFYGRCCWCRNIYGASMLAGVVIHDVWHLSCPVCLRHKLGYPLVHVVRLFWRDDDRQETLPV